MRARCAVFVPQKSLCWLLCKALLLMVIMEAPTVAKPAPKPASKLGKQPAAKPAAASSSIPVAKACATVQDYVGLEKEVLHCPCSAVGAFSKLMD